VRSFYVDFVTKYESDSQIGLSRQNFETIEVKCAKKVIFNYIYYAIMVKVIFVFNYNDVTSKYFYIENIFFLNRDKEI